MKLHSSAVISNCGLYRYELSREFPSLLGSDNKVLFVMLNPSTADAKEDDPTIRRCIGFAKSWGYGGLTVANLYALRSTDPNALKTASDPIGSENNDVLERLLKEHESVVCAWGNEAESSRVSDFVSLANDRELMCLGTNKSGMPKHPLYLSSKTERESWAWNPEVEDNEQ